MQFVNPSFLYALAVLAIPVIIHPVSFPTLQKGLFPQCKVFGRGGNTIEATIETEGPAYINCTSIGFGCLGFCICTTFYPGR